jgi:ABC-type sugar transport system ATPase subunit
MPRSVAGKHAGPVLSLDPLLDRFPRELSAGQRQRVAMGRAVVRDPKVFLLDEPLSNLDAKLRVAMRAEIKALHQRLKTTTVYVMHDQIEAMTMADRILSCTTASSSRSVHRWSCSTGRATCSSRSSSARRP